MNKMQLLFCLDAWALFTLQLLQLFGLDYYVMMVVRKNWNSRYPNILFLVLNIMLTLLFCHTFHNCYKEYKYARSKKIGQVVDRKPKYTIYLNCIFWSAYVIILFGKIVLISNNITNLDLVSPNDFMGPQMLKILIALSGIVFYLLVSAECIGRQVNREKWPTNSWIVEIFDSVEILSIIIFTEAAIGYTLEYFIYATAFLNFMLPVWILYSVSQPENNKPIVQPICYNFLHLMLVQMPFLSIRLYMWIKYSQNASVFIMKNILHLVFFLHSQLYPFMIEAFKKKRYSPENDHNEGEPEIILTNRKCQTEEESIEIM